MGTAMAKYRSRTAQTKTKTQIVTSQQRLIVMRTWEKLSADMAQMGIAVMMRIFELRPTYKNSFSFCQKSGNDLLQDKMFRAHAFVFTQAAHAVVDNIDNLDDEVKDLFFSLGRAHVGLPDFRVSYFGIVSDAMSYVWAEQLRERFSVQAEAAWRCVFTFISGTMTDGYIQEQMDRERLAESNMSDERSGRSIYADLPPSMRIRVRSVAVTQKLLSPVSAALPHPKRLSEMTSDGKDTTGAQTQKISPASATLAKEIAEIPPDPKQTKEEGSAAVPTIMLTSPTEITCAVDVDSIETCSTKEESLALTENDVPLYHLFRFRE